MKNLFVYPSYSVNMWALSETPCTCDRVILRCCACDRRVVHTKCNNFGMCVTVKNRLCFRFLCLAIWKKGSSQDIPFFPLMEGFSR